MSEYTSLTPWRLDVETQVVNDGNEETVRELRDADGVTVAYVHGDKDAKRIMHAINSHQVLVKTLKSCLAHVGCAMGDELRGRAESALRFARAEPE